MNSYTSVESLAKTIVGDLELKNKCVIGIDGKDGAGKTSLANELSKLLGCSKISFDDYLDRNQGDYVASLKRDEINTILSKEYKIVILDGVCLLHVANELDIFVDILIYVKSMRHGLWYDVEICNPQKNVNLILEEKERRLLVFSEWEVANSKKDPPNKVEIQLSAFTKELIHYHANFQPYMKANYYFEVTKA